LGEKGPKVEKKGKKMLFFSWKMLYQYFYEKYWKMLMKRSKKCWI
jgi:hypothetical protein